MSAQPPNYNPELYTPETLRYVQGDSKRPQSVLEYNPQHEVPEVGTSDSPVEVGARAEYLNRAPSPVSTIATKTQDGSSPAPLFPEPSNANNYPFSQKFTSQMAGDDSQDALVAKGVNPAKSSRYQDLEYADPHSQDAAGATKRSGPLGKFFSDGRYPLQQRIENKKRGIGIQSRPYVVWAMTIAMIGVFIYELVLNGREQGSPISLKPFINPMLGPSGSALINLGSRFPPCMKNVADVPISTPIACMNNTENPISQVCTVGDLCGFGGIPSGQEPNQWFRFILPIFLHAGIIHLLLNMFAQLSLSAQIEREMGSGGFLLVYSAAGIFGNVLGGNFSLVGVPSVGASGAIFGTLAVTWVDLVAHWKYHYRPVRKLVFMIIELIIGIAIGFIPYVDNFAHIGGFLMGLLVGTVFYPVISESKRHKTIMWIFRLAAIPLAIVLFVLLIRNFYTADPYAACSGCRYLSCIPTAANNRCKGTGLTTTSVNN
ncbi:hypothetical protein EST38_g5218 [Candolleomyces aberdarensis]|uniref:Rhomboid-type serine protease n=1 Tax=Candolleomyces aberdarensis TaxID=2316362 RepID=A0A4Q2DN33_9AGAR|nr:hypothetical protein EST38_g5218 [Candolleomyces aberdarensis]